MVQDQDSIQDPPQLLQDQSHTHHASQPEQPEPMHTGPTTLSTAETQEGEPSGPSSAKPPRDELDSVAASDPQDSSKMLHDVCEVTWLS